MLRRTPLKFPDHTAPSVRDLVLMVGEGEMLGGIVKRWHTIPETLVSRIRSGSRIRLKLKGIGLQIINNPNGIGS